MARKRYTAEQIIGYLRQAEVMIGHPYHEQRLLRIRSGAFVHTTSWPEDSLKTRTLKWGLTTFFNKILAMMIIHNYK